MARFNIVDPSAREAIQQKWDNLVDKWIAEKRFPANDEVNRFYFDNQNKIDSLIENKEALKKSLCKYVFEGEDKIPDELSAEEIDAIYEFLKKRGKYQQYKLNFMVLAGDFIRAQQRESNYHWGLLRSKQFLNPVMSLIGNESDHYNRRKGKIVL